MVGIPPLWLNCLFRIQETKQYTQIEQMNDLATGKPSGVEKNTPHATWHVNSVPGGRWLVWFDFHHQNVPVLVAIVIWHLLV